MMIVIIINCLVVVLLLFLLLYFQVVYDELLALRVPTKSVSGAAVTMLLGQRETAIKLIKLRLPHSRLEWIASIYPAQINSLIYNYAFDGRQANEEPTEKRHKLCNTTRTETRN